MKTIVLSGLALCIVVSLVACGGSGPGATPKESYEAIKKLAEKKDFAGFWEMMSPGAKKKFEELYDQTKKGWADLPPEVKAEMEKQMGDPTKMATAKEFFIKGAEKNPEKATEISKAEFVEVKEEGNKAKVKYKIGTKEDSLDLEKVDGKWYVSLE